MFVIDLPDPQADKASIPFPDRKSDRALRRPNIQAAAA